MKKAIITWKHGREVFSRAPENLFFAVRGINKPSVDTWLAEGRVVFELEVVTEGDDVDIVVHKFAEVRND